MEERVRRGVCIGGLSGPTTLALISLTLSNQRRSCVKCFSAMRPFNVFLHSSIGQGEGLTVNPSMAATSTRTPSTKSERDNVYERKCYYISLASKEGSPLNLAKKSMGNDFPRAGRSGLGCTSGHISEGCSVFTCSHRGGKGFEGWLVATSGDSTVRLGSRT